MSNKNEFQEALLSVVRPSRIPYHECSVYKQKVGSRIDADMMRYMMQKGVKPKKNTEEWDSLLIPKVSTSRYPKMKLRIKHLCRRRLDQNDRPIQVQFCFTCSPYGFADKTSSSPLNVEYLRRCLEMKQKFSRLLMPIFVTNVYSSRGQSSYYWNRENDLVSELFAVESLHLEQSSADSQV